jgi:bifunctional DNA-binding transcriptional regulator/antitoxin component of YhaV-PrlF toxin-antitoxin module
VRGCSVSEANFLAGLATKRVCTSHLEVSVRANAVRVTIPKQIRSVLGIEPGDFVEYAIRADNVVTLKRVERFDVEFHQALESTLDEWQTAEEEEAFRDL